MLISTSVRFERLYVAKVLIIYINYHKIKSKLIYIHPRLVKSWLQVFSKKRTQNDSCK